MNKSFFVILLIGFSSNALAGWTVIDKSDEITLYGDLEKIRQVGKTARMWTLRDHNTPASFGRESYRSIVELDEFDCDEGKSRVLQLTAYSGQMRDGDSVYTASDTPWPWKYAQPETILDAALKAACAKAGNRR